jgi:hypothetical protein
LLIVCSINKAAFVTQTAVSKQPSMNSFWGQKFTFSGSLWQLEFLSAYGSFMALIWLLFVDRLLAILGSFSALITNAK